MKYPNHPFSIKSFVSWHLILVLFFSPGCASSHSSSPKAKVDQAPSLAEEISVGQKIHQEILSSYYTYTKPDVVSYVDEVGEALASRAKRKLPYRFTILYNDKVYAASAPGGFIYITTGMMNFLDNEAELAAILAHEIAELQYRDPAFSKMRKVVSDFAQTGATVAPAFGQIGMLAVLGFVMIHAVSSVNGKRPEDKIRDADRLAMQYLADTGYDPQSLLDVLEKFTNSDPKVVPLFTDYFETRPITEDRIADLQKGFSKLSLEGRELLTRPKIYQDMTKPVREIYRT